MPGATRSIFDDIGAVCSRLRNAKTKGQLLDLLAREVMTYSLHDLAHIRGVMERELRHLPPSYRNRLYPKLIQQVFGTHHRLITLHRKGSFSRSNETVDPKMKEYCDMVEAACTAQEGLERRRTLLYYLLAAFTMFVLGEPGHPVGTPFPGGARVEERGGAYYCPIREKEDDVETSICPYCPAHQENV
jgi:uncharacterized protein (UPF0305 family)